MPISFPLSPSYLDTYSYGGRTWIWNGTAWDSVGTIQGSIGPFGPQGTQGHQGPQGLTGIQGFQGVQGIQGNQGPNAAISFGPTPPVSPLVGDRWVDSNSGIEYTWIDDGSNQTWVEVSASGFAGSQGIQGPAGYAQGVQGLQGYQGEGTYTISPTPPVGPSIGDTWLDSNDGRIYIWDGSEWFEAYGNQRGLQGTQGIQGFIGIQGPFGGFAAQGFTGTQGTQGIQGTQGLQIQGTQGSQGPIGLSGIPTGGSTGQILAKNSATNYDTIWVDTDLNQISPLLLMGA